MRNQIIGIDDWLKTSIGISLLEWESSHLDAAVVNRFGYHALQLGLPELHGLRANRMPHQWLALERFPTPTPESLAHPVDLLCDFRALPFPADCIDLVLLPHVLEFSPDPQLVLQEVERVLIHEGRVMICGFNPFSLNYPQLPEVRKFIPYWRLKNDLNRLGLEVESIHWQSLLGIAYCMVAVKHVRGMHLLKSPWKTVMPKAEKAIPATKQQLKIKK